MVRLAVSAIGPGTLVHCEHGQDRTGVAIGLYRLHTGWTEEHAEDEMLAHGFHRSLIGLWEWWELNATYYGRKK